MEASRLHQSYSPVSMRLPHLEPFDRFPLLFITACTHDRRPLLATPAAVTLLRDIWYESLAIDDWAVGRYVIMPDHIHLFARPGPSAKPLAKWIQGWKSISARQLTASRLLSSPVWQRDYFDHFVRSVDSYSEKWDYVRANPVRAGLVSHVDDWPHQGEIHPLRF